MDHDIVVAKVMCELELIQDKLSVVLNYFYANQNENQMVRTTLDEIQSICVMRRNNAATARYNLTKCGFIQKYRNAWFVPSISETQLYNKIVNSSRGNYSSRGLRNSATEIVPTGTKNSKIVPTGTKNSKIVPPGYAMSDSSSVCSSTGEDLFISPGSCIESITVSTPIPDCCVTRGNYFQNGVDETKMNSIHEKIIYIYSSFNKALLDCGGRRGAFIPIAIRKGRGFGESSIPGRIQEWINQIGDDWQEVWDMFLEKVRVSKFYADGSSDGRFKPSLDWIFSKEDDEITFKIERTLGGRHDGFEKEIPHNQTVEEQIKHYTNPRTKIISVD